MPTLLNFPELEDYFNSKSLFSAFLQQTVCTEIIHRYIKYTEHDIKEKEYGSNI